MTTGLQPFLHDATITLCAPTQVWSRASGDMSAAIDGVYHGDRRMLSDVAVTWASGRAEPIGAAPSHAGRTGFDSLLRSSDDPTPDPHVRVTRDREVVAGRMTETLRIRSVLPSALHTTVEVRLVPDFRQLSDVKSGTGHAEAWYAAHRADGVRIDGVGVSGGPSIALTAADARWRIDHDAVTLTWDVRAEPGTEASVTWIADLADPGLVVTGPTGPSDWTTPTGGVDRRLARWADVALDDLAALRLALPEHPEDTFLAAGAPWFFTLFGRDSLWAARMMLPVDTGLAASTLRVLARLQGSVDDPATEEEPGKIPHELRAGELRMPGEGIVLPPLYYGTVDATALWVCVLVDAHRAGMAESDVRALLPALRAALAWIDRSTPADGFLSYIDRTGHGLANQGWKDSGDSVQWRDGRLAEGPIALCEVQGYAYEACVGAADLLDRLGEPGAEDLRTWASDLRRRFADRFWVRTPEGRYPAIALDRDGAPVDTLTSNIGHLIGTGLLDHDDEVAVAALLLGPTMSSGFGIRTMSTDAAGYWPLGYHRGAVWAHDTAIAAHGMARAGLRDEAATVVAELIDAAETFAYRMPELYAGDDRSERAAPAPYPAACRPQAWSAAAAITCLEIARS
ncbi:glycogen debranching N-terminal domain-containing protein [Microbacterium sp. P01]|uniref:glycogen debranching N-terminal domain-containing protein n=1 Tax=Microbacterium sp. P01 TaxID=3366261 RepID=UPI00367204B4